MTTEILGTAPSAKTADVVAAIKLASRETGSDFDYLLATAQRESNLDNTAKSRSSSAAGLFQFIEQTWLSLIKRYGSEHGLGHYADAVNRTESGRMIVGSPEMKSAILALREDPKISALMAGEAAAATKQSLECALGRAVCPGELYAAHFLGEGAARRLIQLSARDSGARADLAFPEAAKANRNIFYHADGRAKTVGEVHAWAVGEPTVTQQPTMIAASSAPRSSRALQAPSASARLARSGVEDSLGMTIRPARLTFPVSGQTRSANATLPRSPLALSAGALEILSALASPSLVRRQT